MQACREVTATEVPGRCQNSMVLRREGSFEGNRRRIHVELRATDVPRNIEGNSPRSEVQV